MNGLVRLIQLRLSWGVLLAATLVLFPFDWLSERWPAFGSLFERIFVSAREHALGHCAVFLSAGLLVLCSLPRLRRTPVLYLITMSMAALGEEFFQGLSRWRLPDSGDGRDLAFDLLGFALAYLLACIWSARQMRRAERNQVSFPAGEWFQVFQENARQRLVIPWEQGIKVEPHLRRPLIRSLQRFQVGEQGDGLHLSKAAARTQQAEYRATIDLFIKEEQEHSRLLARSITGLGGTLLRHHWSDTCFVFLRRLLGLRMELLVLLVAEVIAQVYYQALHNGTADVVLQNVFAQILHDEHNHVAFHCAYLRQALASLAPPARWLLAQSWGLLFRLVCLLVICDHRSVFRALRMTPQTCWRECLRAFEATGILTRS
ncbi:MAG TPA: ferritin-like domain-containing protein [Ktedonobacteraceae bacterium]|jgi:hypothetical protein